MIKNIYKIHSKDKMVLTHDNFLITQTSFNGWKQILLAGDTKMANFDLAIVRITQKTEEEVLKELKEEYPQIENFELVSSVEWTDWKYVPE